MEAPIIAIAIAILVGIAAGFLPGMHPNSIGAVMLEVFGDAAWMPFALIALLGAHTAVEFFSSVFLGVPEANTAVGTLPGVRMMRQGKGREAAVVIGASILVATAVAVALTPLAQLAMPPMMEVISPNTLWLLGLAVVALLATEKRWGKIAKAALVFSLSAALGQIAFGLHIQDVLFPMFVGFFTLPSLLLAGHAADGEEKIEGIMQKDGKGADEQIGAKTERAEGVSELDFLPHICAGILLGALADFLPGISTPAQIAVFASLLVPLDEPKKFLALVSAISASHTVFAITAVDAIGKARVGAVALANSVEPITSANLPALLFAYMVATGVGVLALVAASKWASKRIGKLDFSLAGKILAAYLVLAVFFVCGWLGLLVLVSACAIGCLPIFFGVRRTHVMGGIIGPSMIRLVA